MGEYVTRNKAGSPFLFRIKGDKPSPTEMARINQRLAGVPATSVAPEPAPEAPGVGQVFGSGLARAWNTAQASGDTLMQSFYDTLGNDPAKAKEWGEAAQAQRAERDTYASPGGITDEGSNKLHAIVGATAENAPGMAAGLAGMYYGGAAGAAIGSAVPVFGTAAGAVVGGLLGGAAAYFPMTLNANAERQIAEHGKVKDWGKAYGAAGVAASIETITDKVGGKIVGVVWDAAKIAGKAVPRATEKAIKEASKEAIDGAMTVVAKKVGMGSALGAVTGAAEEVIQQGLERWQAELPLMDDKSKKEYLESAIMGGILESVFGGGVGAYAAHQTNKLNKQLAEAKADMDAQASALGSSAEANVPAHQARREGKYAEPPPPPEPPREPIKDPGRLLPDFSAPTREQTYKELSHKHKDDNLPPGLREEEVGDDPLKGSGEQPTSILTEARQAVDPNFAASAVRGKRTLPTAEEFDADMRSRLSPDARDKLDRLRAETARLTGKPISSVPHIPPVVHDTGVPPVSPAPQIRPAPTTPSTDMPRVGEHGPPQPKFTEDEYRHAIETLRDEGTLSHDKIAKILGVSKPQAEAYFAEMLSRNDAHPAGDHNQYAKITVPKGMSSRKQNNVRGRMSPYRARDYIVKPVRPAGTQPYSVHVNGKRMGQKGGNAFTSRQEAQDFIDTKVPAKVRKDATIVEDTSNLQYGIHHQSYEHMPDREQRLIGEEVVDTFMTEAEAREAIKEYDPAYSPQTNKQRTKKKAPEERAAAINRDYEQEMGAPGEHLRTLGESILGPGRLKLQIVPRIIDPKNPDAIIEGSSNDAYQTDPQGIRKLIGNVIRLSSDLHNPNLTEEQRTKLMEEVLNHELVHALRGLDLLTRQEWDTLFKHAANAKVPGKSYTWLQRSLARTGALEARKPGDPPVNPQMVAEEAVAEMIRHYLNDPTAFRNPERGLMRKIADFIKKLMRLGERHDAADLIDTIFSGGIADRQIGHGGLGPRNDDDVRYSLYKTDNFYLETDRFLQKVTTEEAPKNHWIKMLSQAGIKPEELNWLGIKQWLQDIPVERGEDGKGGMVHRNDLINFVRASGPKVEPVIFAKQAHPDLGNAAFAGPRWGGRSHTAGNLGGDDTYAEVAFVFGGKKDEPVYYDKGGHMMAPVDDAGTLKPLGNVLAFARFRDVTEDGKRILFLEEIQSDLHQQGSMKGYYSKSAVEKYNELTKAVRDGYDEIHRLSDNEIRLKDEMWAMRKNYATPDGEIAAKKAEIDANYKTKQDLRHKVAGIQQTADDMWPRLHIPNAPFKSNWEDYVIRRMIRHASEHGYDGVAWHGSPESVSETEAYGELDTRTDEKGKIEYRAFGDTPVSPIINRYLLKLPRITRGIAEPFGVNLDHKKVDARTRPPAWMPDDFQFQPNTDDRIIATFPDRGMLHTIINQLSSLHNAMVRNDEYLTASDEKIGHDLLNKLKRAQQISINRREFEMPEIFETAGFEPDEIDRVISWTENSDFYAGPASENVTGFQHDNYQLLFNSAMKEGFEEGNQPFFSMVRERKQEIMANPKFQQWFGEGVVTEDDNTPKVVYHYTDSDQDFSRFHRLTHFGTAKSAEERMAGRYGEINELQASRDFYFENWADPRGQRMYPAFLNLRRPLHIVDDKSHHDAFAYGLAMQREGVLSDEEFKRIMKLRTNAQNNYTVEGEKAALTEIVKAMEKAGYDGFSYINQGEDVGSMSYVALHPVQIKSIFNQGTWSEEDDNIRYSKLEARGADLLENDDKFKHWFNGSRVVGDDDNPLLVFHGTGSNFDTFDHSFHGKATTHPTAGLGFFFTVDPVVATDFAGVVIDQNTWPPETFHAEGSNIVPSFLSIKNPYRMPLREFTSLVARAGWTLNTEATERSRKEVADLRRKLIDAGHDGIHIGSDPRAEGTEYGADAWVAFRPGQIKSALAEEFSQESDSFKYSMVVPRYSATAPLGQRVPGQPPLDQLSELHNRITYDNLSPWVHKLIEKVVPDRFSTKAKGKVDDTIISLQDRMLSIGRLIDRMKKNGGFITNENDVYLREQLYSSQVDAHLTANDKDFYKKMTDTIAGLHVTQHDVREAASLDEKVALILKEYPNPKHALAELYLYAQHAQERNALMRERNEALAAKGERVLQHAAGSGLGDGTAQMVLDWFDRKPFAREFNDPTNANSVRSRMRAIINNTNDIRVNAGLTIDYRTALHPKTGTPLQNYADYVPIRGRIDEAVTFRGDDEINDFFAKTGKGFNIRGNEDFSALGRESLGRDLVAHAIMQNQEAVVRAGKNKVAQSFRQLILDNPAAMSHAAEILNTKRTKYYFDRSRGVVKEILDNKLMTDPSILKGKIDGQMFFIKMKDKKIERAMGSKSGLGSSTGMPSLFKGLLAVNRFLAATRTSYNPEFMVANMLRDLEAAMINLSETGKKGVRRKVMASVFPALKGVRDSLRQGNPTGEWAKVHEEFRRHGGHTAVFGIRELADTINNINGHLSEDVSGNMSKVKKPIRALFKFVSDYNLAIENGTRLAAYKVLRDQYLELSGNPHDPQNQLRAREMAAFAAKNLTVNFNMGGESKSMATALYMFYNASIQGTLALLNPFIRSRRMKIVWASVLTAGAVQDMLMSMLSPEDDDGEKTYDKIPEHVLEHNLIFMDPFGISERGYFKFPMPYLMNGIYNFGRAASRTARGKYTAGELMSTGGMTLIDSLNPLGATNSFLNFVAPSVFDPFVDLSMNEDFTGSPIAPPVSPYDNTGEARSQQYWNNTHPAYVNIADWMSLLTGREGDYLPGKMEASPNQVEYAVDWVTGGTGTFLARAYTLIKGGATGELDEMELDAGDIPFLRKAYGSITAKNDLTDYIEGRDQVLRVRKALRDARKEGDNEAYMGIMRRYPKEYKIAAKVNALENARKKISAKIKRIRESRNLTDEQKEIKVKELKARQDLLVGRGNDVLAAID